MFTNLKGHDGLALKAEVTPVVLSNLPDQPGEGKLPDKQFRGLLVPPDLAEGHSAGPVAVALLLVSTCGSIRLPALDVSAWISLWLSG